MIKLTFERLLALYEFINIKKHCPYGTGGAFKTEKFCFFVWLWFQSLKYLMSCVGVYTSSQYIPFLNKPSQFYELMKNIGGRGDMHSVQSVSKEGHFCKLHLLEGVVIWKASNNKVVMPAHILKREVNLLKSLT